MWVKLTGIEIETMKAIEIARKMEGYVTETCQELRKEITQLQTQVKDGLARALEVESSIGAQDAELARVTAALEALQKQGGGMATTDDTPGAAASTPAQAGAPQNPTQAGQQEATLPSANPWSLGAGPIPPVPPEEFYSWPGSVPPTRPLGASVHQAGTHTAGPSASAHPFATPPMDATTSQVPLSVGQRISQLTQVPVSPFGLPTRLGPSCPGLVPQETLVVGFGDAVNYRLYRLQNVNPMPTSWEQEHILDLRKKIRGRDFRIEEFDGTDPMSLLTFLPVLRDTFNEMALTEGIGVRLLSYILKDSAKEVYVTQTTAGYQTASFTPTSHGHSSSML